MSIIKTKQDLDNLLLQCVERNATDLHFSVGAYPSVKVKGEVHFIGAEGKIATDDVGVIIKNIIPERKIPELREKHNCSFSYSVKGRGRFRVNIFTQRGSYCVSFRIGKFHCPTQDELNLPKEVEKIFDIKSGLIIVTGSKGSGRTSTAACIINRLKRDEAYYIDTVEDPIEFLFRHEKSVVNQMEIGLDVNSILEGFKIALRNYSDVIFLSSMMDQEVIRLALETAHAGKLIIVVGESQGVTETIRHLIDIFPDDNANYIRSLLASSIKCILSQQLIPDVNGDDIPLCEILYGLKGVSNLIRENKIPQINKVLESSVNVGMLSVDNHLADLHGAGMISTSVAKEYCKNWNVLSQKIVTK